MRIPAVRVRACCSCRALLCVWKSVQKQRAAESNVIHVPCNYIHPAWPFFAISVSNWHNLFFSKEKKSNVTFEKTWQNASGSASYISCVSESADRVYWSQRDVERCPRNGILLSCFPFLQISLLSFFYMRIVPSTFENWKVYRFSRRRIPKVARNRFRFSLFSSSFFFLKSVSHVEINDRRGNSAQS